VQKRPDEGTTRTPTSGGIVREQNQRGENAGPKVNPHATRSYSQNERPMGFGAADNKREREKSAAQEKRRQNRVVICLRTEKGTTRHSQTSAGSVGPTPKKGKSRKKKRWGGARKKPPAGVVLPGQGRKEARET